MQLGLQILDRGAKPIQVGTGQRNKLGIGLSGQLPSLLKFVPEPRQPLGRLHYRDQPRMLPTQRPEPRGIPGHIGISQRLGYLLRSGEGLAESVLHRLRLGRRRLALILAPEPIHPSGGVHQALFARKERMALSADLDMDRRGRRAGFELIPARTDRGDLPVDGMQIGLHAGLPKAIAVKASRMNRFRASLRLRLERFRCFLEAT